MGQSYELDEPGGQENNMLALKLENQVPERTGRALLHWVNGPDVRPLFYGASVSSPIDADAFWTKWLNRRDPTRIAPAALGGQIDPLPAELADSETKLRGTELFRTIYEPHGAQFVSTTIDSLVTPQWWVDTDHVETLVRDMPADDDLEGLFRFCFAPGSLGSPLMLGMNAAVLTSRKRGLGMISPLRVASATPEKVTFEFDALPRPNWIWLSVVPENGSILILNGVHHIAALQRAGRQRAFALLHQGPLQGIMNFQDPSLFKPERLLSPRPPLVSDFYDDQIADEVRVRAVDQFMRFGVQNPPEIGFVPQAQQ